MTGCLSIPMAAMGIVFFEEENQSSRDLNLSTPMEDEIDSSEVIVPFDYENSLIFSEFWEINDLGAYPSNISFNKDSLISCFDSSQHYCFPIKTYITSNYGSRWGRQHHGIDIALKVGDSVHCAFDGKVRFATRNHNGFGNLIIVRHENGLETYYAHLSKIDVEPNQLVKAGDYIGKGGMTGRVTGPHLHFETRFKGKSIDPLSFIDPNSLDLK